MSGYQELVLEDAQDDDELDLSISIVGSKTAAQDKKNKKKEKEKEKLASKATDDVPSSFSSIKDVKVTTKNKKDGNGATKAKSKPSSEKSDGKIGKTDSWLSLRRLQGKKGDDDRKVSAAKKNVVRSDSEDETRNDEDEDKDEEERIAGVDDDFVAENKWEIIENTTVAMASSNGAASEIARDMAINGSSKYAPLLNENREITNGLSFGRLNNIPENDSPLTLLVACNLAAGAMEGREWLHPPESLMKNSVVYNAKFLGMTDVDQPTGIDVVKEAIVKTKFNNQLKLSEGQRPSKVQISISLDGISVLDPKNKDILHYRPLNAISYCADDKMDKGIFTFIAKYPDSNKHSCFVFESEKSAEEITLTIGQSFDLAYQKFVEASSKDLNLKKQFLSLQKRVQDLMQENGQLKKRVTELESLVDPKLLPESEKSKHFKTMSLTRHKSYESNGHTSTPLVPSHAPGKRLNSLPATIQSSVVSSSTPPLLAPPPIAARPHNMSLNSSNSKGQDLFGSPQFVPSPTTPSSITASPEVFSKWPNPFATGCTTDPFGMSIFTPAILAPKSADQQFVDLQSPLISSSSFPVDFSLTELDPLRSK